jgi:hypothetical protein
MAAYVYRNKDGVPVVDIVGTPDGLYISKPNAKDWVLLEDAPEELLKATDKENIISTVNSFIEYEPPFCMYDRLRAFDRDHYKADQVVYDGEKVRMCKVEVLQVNGDDGEKVSKPITKEISELVLILDEDIQSDNGETVFKFKGYGVKDGRSIEFDMPASEAIDTAKFKAKLVNYAGGDNIIGDINLAAVQKLTKNIIHTKRITRPVYEGGKFLVPGLHDDPHVIYDLSPYCPVEVFPSDYKEALRATLDINQRQVINVVAILAAPMASAFLPEEPFGYGLFAQTGTWKTSVIQQDYAIYGVDCSRDESCLKLAEGGTTLNAALKVAHDCGVMPFRTENLKGTDEATIRKYIAIVQGVMEGSGKARLNKENDLRKSEAIDCNMFVTGELKPDDGATTARVLGVNWNMTKEETPALTMAQLLVDRMPGVGYEWLRFLEQNHDMSNFRVYRDGLLQKYSANNYANTGRLATIGAILKVAHDLAIQSPLGDVLKDYDFDGVLEEVLMEQGLSVTDKTDLGRFLNIIRELFISNPELFLEPMVAADDELKYYGSGYRSYERIGKVIQGELFLLPDLAIGAAIKRLPYGQVFNKEAIHSALKNADMLVKQGEQYTYKARFDGDRAVRGWLLRGDRFPLTEKEEGSLVPDYT